MRLLTTILCFSALIAADESALKFTISLTPLDVAYVFPVLAPTLNPNRERGIIAYIHAKDELTRVDILDVTITYQKDGKMWTRTQQATLVPLGCWPRPCRTAVAVFLIGDVPVKEAKVAVKPVVWESREVAAE